MKRTFYLFLFILVIPIVAQENMIKKNPFSINNNIELKSNILNHINEFILLNADENIIDSMYNEKNDSLIFELPFSFINSNDSISINLTMKDLLGNHFQIKTASGENVDFELPIFFQGKINSNENSFVCLTLQKHNLKGLIALSEKNLVLGRLKDTISNLLSNTYILYNDKTANFNLDFNYNDVIVIDSNDYFSKSIKKNTLLSSSLSCINIGIGFECAYDMFLSFNMDYSEINKLCF